MIDAERSGPITEAIGSQLETSAPLGGSLVASLDGDDLGAALGAEVGERVGRELGESVGRAMQASFAESVERGDDAGELTAAIGSAVREALVDYLGDVDGLESVLSSVQEAAPDGLEPHEEGVPPEGESASGGAGGEPAPAPPSDEETGSEASDPDGLRRETLTDFLAVMDYRDLQSVAKDVGVRANLSREELIAGIVETVTDDGIEPDEPDDAPNDEEG